MPAGIQVLATDLGQPPEANNPKPFHSLAEGTFSIFPSLVDREAKSANWPPLLAEPDLRRFAKEPD